MVHMFWSFCLLKGSLQIVLMILNTTSVFSLKLTSLCCIFWSAILNRSNSFMLYHFVIFRSYIIDLCGRWTPRFFVSLLVCVLRDANCIYFSLLVIFRLTTQLKIYLIIIIVSLETSVLVTCPIVSSCLIYNHSGRYFFFFGAFMFLQLYGEACSKA